GNERDNFLIKHMNLWIQRKDAYFPLDRWGDKPLPDLTGKECYVGVDLSSKIDLTAVTAVFPLDNGEYAVISKSFMPEESLDEKERKDKVPYSRWVREGWITLTTGDVIDVEFIATYLVELSEQ